MGHIQHHENRSRKAFFKRTVSAQLHLLGFVVAVVGLSVLLHYVRLKNDYGDFLACLIFGLTSILVFGVSTVYHFMNDGYRISQKLERGLEDLDHFAIFLFIAGTYTPFLINVIRQPWQTILLVLIWTVGIAGIVYTHYRPRLPAWARNRFVYTGLFLLMGWVLVVRAGEAFEHMTSHAAFLLVAGGVSYSVGAIFYATKWPNLFKGVFGFHELWHVMVLMGYGFHYFLILDFYRHTV